MPSRRLYPPIETEDDATDTESSQDDETSRRTVVGRQTRRSQLAQNEPTATVTTTTTATMRREIVIRRSKATGPAKNGKTKVWWENFLRSRLEHWRSDSWQEFHKSFDWIDGVVLFAVVALLTFLGVRFFATTDACKHPLNPGHAAEFQRDLRVLQQEAPELNRSDVNNTLRAAFRNFFSCANTPTTLLLLGDDGAKLRDLAWKIGRLFSERSRSTFDVTSRTSRGELHDTFVKSLSAEPYISVVSGIEQLNWDAPLALHAFADRVTRAVKDHSTLLVLTAVGTRGTDERTICEDAAFTILETTWRSAGAPENGIPAIYSRIADYPLCFFANDADGKIA